MKQTGEDVVQKVVSVFALLFLTACATKVDVIPAAFDGSKADATILMGYSYTNKQIPVVDWEAAEKSAKNRCAAWGYNKVDPFEGTYADCQIFNGYGECLKTHVQKLYQCIED